MIRRARQYAASPSALRRWRASACAALLVSWCALAAASPTPVSTAELDAFAHKAMATLNDKNMYDQVPSPFGRGMMTRVAAAAFLGMHSNDHYGQMVVYARMNGVVPGGEPPPANGKGKGKQ